MRLRVAGCRLSRAVTEGLLEGSSLALLASRLLAQEVPCPLRVPAVIGLFRAERQIVQKGSLTPALDVLGDEDACPAALNQSGLSERIVGLCKKAL